MSLHKCSRCGYESNKLSALVGHLQRKTECPATLKKASRSKQLAKCLSKLQTKKRTMRGGDNTGFGNVICLGAYGGISSGNLSCYLLQIGIENNKPIYICLDGGSPVEGLWKYNQANPSNKLDISQIKAYLISHAHLDHIAGLAIMTPGMFGKFEQNNRPKVIAAKHVLDNMGNHIFNDVIWPKILWHDDTFPGTKGMFEQVVLNDDQSGYTNVNNVSITMDYVTHGNEKGSTVFYITDNTTGETVVYFGDVTNQKHAVPVKDYEADNKLTTIMNKLSNMNILSIFMECAFPENTQSLYGHLKPSLVFDILSRLTLQKQYNLFITHMKPDISNNVSVMDTINSQVQGMQIPAIKQIYFPEQGKSYLK